MSSHPSTIEEHFKAFLRTRDTARQQIHQKAIKRLAEHTFHDQLILAATTPDQATHGNAFYNALELAETIGDLVKLVAYGSCRKQFNALQAKKRQRSGSAEEEERLNFLLRRKLAIDWPTDPPPAT